MYLKSVRFNNVVDVSFDDWLRLNWKWSTWLCDVDIVINVGIVVDVEYKPRIKIVVASDVKYLSTKRLNDVIAHLWFQSEKYILELYIRFGRCGDGSSANQNPHENNSIHSVLLWSTL